MMVPQALPSGETLGDAFARELALLIGTAYQPSDGTLIAEDLRTIGDSLADVYTTLQNALNEAFTNTAVQLLAEWEFRLGLPTDPSIPIADRQAAATAKRRANGGASATRILAAMRSIYDGATLATNSCVAVAAFSTPAYPTRRDVFQFVVVVKPEVWGDAVKLSHLRTIVRQMKRAHTKCVITTRIGFRFADPLSLFGRDVFG